MLWLLYWLDVIQDFVSELGMKQQMPLVEIRILLIYHVIVMSDIAKSCTEPTKIGYIFRKYKSFEKSKFSKQFVNKSSWYPS